MQKAKNEDTSIRVTKHIRNEALDLKRMLNITSDDKRYCLEDTIKYAIDFTIANDKSIEKVRDQITYAVYRGRLYE